MLFTHEVDDKEVYFPGLRIDALVFQYRGRGSLIIAVKLRATISSCD